LFVMHVLAPISLCIVSLISNIMEVMLVPFMVRAVGWEILCVGGVQVYVDVCALFAYSLFIISVMSCTSVIFRAVCPVLGVSYPFVGFVVQSFNSAICNVVLYSILPITFWSRHMNGMIV